jgi:hypothetical protein
MTWSRKFNRFSDRNKKVNQKMVIRFIEWFYCFISYALKNLGLYGLWSGGSLSCNICCDTGTRFFRSCWKSHRIQSPLLAHKGKWRIYSNPDPHGSPAIVWDTLHVSPKYFHGTGYFDITTRNHSKSGTIVQRYEANKELRVWDHRASVGASYLHVHTDMNEHGI